MEISPQTEADKLLNKTVRAFLDTMTAQQDKPRFNKNLRRFQSLARKLFETCPDTGSETMVAGLVQIGVPLAAAQQDVLVLLSRKGGE